MDAHLRLRQIARLNAAVAATLLAGMIGFHETLHESWFQSFYRAVVTMTLTGLDTVPASDSARAVSIALVVAGLTIIAYAGAVIVEAIAGGVLRARWRNGGGRGRSSSCTTTSSSAAMGASGGA